MTEAPVFIDPLRDTFAGASMRMPCPVPGCGARYLRRCDGRGVHPERKALYMAEAGRVGRPRAHARRVPALVAAVTERPGLSSRQLYEFVRPGVRSSQWYKSLRAAEADGLVRPVFVVGSAASPQAGRRAIWYPVGVDA
jgi:hypothetical protein